MKNYVCTVCGFVYEEAAGLPGDGISPGTLWADLPDDWACPMCGADKDMFELKEAASPASAAAPAPQAEQSAAMPELSSGMLSALFSNLAKGFDKQYRPEEAGLFGQLADYYQNQVAPPDESGFPDLSNAIQTDLDAGYPAANGAAKAASDRGALRALVWSEKVTRIQASVLTRFEKQGDALLADTNVYVCDICGFIFIGNNPPDICPVCKVPSLKILKIGKEAM